MHLRYGLGNKPPLSRSEVAKVLGVTYETIRNTEKGALKSLRESVTDDAFMDYLNDNLWK
jgi:DNA-directed RNA polymerase sigma subunit (sigma70/sigma32)